jgi:polyphenol oxidase
MLQGVSLIYGVSTRAEGNMSFSSGQTAHSAENRQRFLAGMGIDYRTIVLPHQVHGCRIESVGKEHCGRGSQSSETGLADTDALLTRERNIPIGVQTADCLPIVIFDPGTPAVAIVHAGWRSTRECIVQKTVQRLCDEFKANPQDMRGCLGPAIRPCCYEVGPELAEIFPYSVRNVGNSLRLDLAAENLRQLQAAGMQKKNIFDTGFCTCCRSDAFFSYRREGISCGRMLSVIMLR